MHLKNFNPWVNQTLTIESEKKGLYFTQILRIEDNKLCIQSPFNFTQLLDLIQEELISVYFYNDLKELYVFRSKILLDNGRLFLNKPEDEDIQKVQRRQFFRVQATLTMTLFVPETGEKEESMPFLTHDISGGGICFKAAIPEQFRLHEKVRGDLYLDVPRERRNVPFFAQIVRIDKYLDLSVCSLSFIQIKESDRSAIIRYCTIRQRNYRKMML